MILIIGMMPMDIKCVSCQKELKNGTDTFGDPPNLLCWDCYSALMWDNNTEVTYKFQGRGPGPEWLFARITIDDDESY